METYKELQLEQIKVSPLNPRKHFNQEKMKELAASVKEKGILQPLLVRPVNNHFELVCGERRFKAAGMISLDKVPAVIRHLDDGQVIEIQTIENLQREDVHPMEEAEGYFALSRRPGYDAAKIAEKIGRSVKYVYDRMKLLSLIKEARELFMSDKFTAGHAILLARLSPSQQKEALDPLNRAVFTHEDVQDDLYLTEEERKDEDGEIIKPRSVREFQIWIDDHCRFDRTKVDPMLFPETAMVLKTAKSEEEKVVPITEEHYVQTSARAAERTIGPRSWMRADGKEGSRTCEHSVTGVFVVGPGRGQALKVCLAKEQCKIHWGDWQKERERRQKAPAVNEKQKAKEEAEEKQRKEEQAKREAWKKRFEKARPVLYKSIAEHIKKIKFDAAGLSLFSELIINEFKGRYSSPGMKLLQRGKSAEDFVRYLANMIAADTVSGWDALEASPKLGKRIGLDINKIVNEAVPEEKPAEDPKSKPKKMTMDEQVAKRAAEINREKAAKKGNRKSKKG